MTNLPSASSVTTPASFFSLKHGLLVLTYIFAFFGAAVANSVSAVDLSAVAPVNITLLTRQVEARKLLDVDLIEDVIDSWGSQFAYWLDKDTQGQLDLDIDPEHPIRSLFQKPMQQVCEVLIVGAVLDGPTLACMAVTMGAVTAVSPALALLYRFSASMFCNYLVGKIADIVAGGIDTATIGDQAEDICSGITNLMFQCSDDLMMDPLNCGICSKTVSHQCIATRAGYLCTHSLTVSV